MSDYRRKPESVKALQWDGENEADIIAMDPERLDGRIRYAPGKTRHSTERVLVFNLGPPGIVLVLHVGEWLVLGSGDSAVAMSDDEFQQDFEPDIVIHIEEKPRVNYYPVYPNPKDSWYRG